MNALSPEELSHVLAPLGEAKPFPARAYTDPSLFAWEMAHLFARAWQCVGHESEIAHPGSFVVAPITPPGVIVARGEDLSIRAFHNVCRHRAAALVPCDEGPTPSGRARRFVCPYHGWSYGLSGALIEAKGAPEAWDKRWLNLSPVRVEPWRGFLFATLDDRAPALHEAIAGEPPWLQEPLPLALARRASYVVEANWKLCVENFQESLHFPRVHPALEGLTPTQTAHSRLSDGVWLGGTMDIADGRETVSRSGSRQERALLRPDNPEAKVFDAMLFPTLLTSLQPDYLLTYRLHPKAADQTLVVADTYVHPASLGPDHDLSDVLSFWDEVNEQDRSVCQLQQRGLMAPGASMSRYLPVEDGVHAFDKLVARVYRGDSPWG